MFHHYDIKRADSDFSLLDYIYHFQQPASINPIGYEKQQKKKKKPYLYRDKAHNYQVQARKPFRVAPECLGNPNKESICFHCCSLSNVVSEIYTFNVGHRIYIYIYIFLFIE